VGIDKGSAAGISANVGKQSSTNTMSINTQFEDFFGSGINATLRSHGKQCRFDIRIDHDSHLAPGPVDCEILLQPLDPRGLPSGPLARVDRQRIWLRPADHGRMANGHLWLPLGIEFDLARACYYRLTRS
jgi:hypothetical protein